jgi:hypothetical protein
MKFGLITSRVVRLLQLLEADLTQSAQWPATSLCFCDALESRFRGAVEEVIGWIMECEVENQGFKVNW